MQWQHGKFEKHTNGSLTTAPIKVDGRQLVSDPCKYKEGVYTRYNQPELFEVSYEQFYSIRSVLTSFQRYEVVIDEFHNIKRLNLYQFDGKPLVPLYIAYSPPQMLPTQTLNPTSVATGSSKPSATGSSKHKRSVPDQKLEKYFQPTTSRLMDPDHWWWFGVTCTSLGTLAYVFF